MRTLLRTFLVLLACAAFCGTVLLGLAIASFGDLPSADWEDRLPTMPLPVGAAVSSSAPPPVEAPK